jgi:hypothetical protein
MSAITFTPSDIATSFDALFGGLYEFDLPNTNVTSRMSEEEAKHFVNNLEQMHAPSIPKENRKCPICWSRYDGEDEAERCNNPVKTPCGHIYGRRCIIQSLVGIEPLCPVCRQDMCEMIIS